MIKIANLFIIGLVCWSNAKSNSAIRMDSLPSNERIKVLARISSDSIQLRWAPSDYAVWREGLLNGYVIDRYTIARDELLLPQPELVRLTNSPIKVWNENEWESLAMRNRYGAIAAQAIFGQDFKADVANTDFVSIVDKVIENDQRFYFALYCADLSSPVAQAQGLYFVDRSIKINEKYLYKIRVSHESDTLEGSVFVGDYEDNFLETPSNFQLECKNSVANLRWDRPLLSNYVGYVVERSTDSQNFRPTTEDPIVTLAPQGGSSNRYEYAIDSLDEERQYYYRVFGQSVFGERSLPSEIKSCDNTKEVHISVLISNSFSIGNNSIQIEWECETNSTIKGFLVERASSDNGPYSTLNAIAPVSPSERKFIDLNPGQSNYYRVIALHENGQRVRSHSFFTHLIDSIPPMSPIELSGEVDAFGLIKMRWKDNPEPDLFGFRVYASNNRNEEMAQLTSGPIKLSHYEFKVNPHTLNDSVYFAVAAVDNNQNQSGLSAICALVLPDHVKPSCPIMLPLKFDSSGVVVSWIKSSSKDVVSYDIYRRKVEDSYWTRIKVTQASQLDTYELVDENNLKNVSLLYTVVAIDDARLESPQAVPVMIKVMSSQLRPAVVWSNPIRVDRQKLMLRWDYDQKDVRAFKIYKTVGDHQSVLYKTLNADERKFQDVILEDTKCSYQMLAVFLDGSQSVLSERITLNN